MEFKGEYYWILSRHNTFKNKNKNLVILFLLVTSYSFRVVLMFDLVSYLDFFFVLPRLFLRSLHFRVHFVVWYPISSCFQFSCKCVILCLCPPLHFLCPHFTFRVPTSFFVSLSLLMSPSPFMLPLFFFMLPSSSSFVCPTSLFVRPLSFRDPPPHTPRLSFHGTSVCVYLTWCFIRRCRKRCSPHLPFFFDQIQNLSSPIPMWQCLQCLSLDKIKFYRFSNIK